MKDSPWDLSAVKTSTSSNSITFEAINLICCRYSAIIPIWLGGTPHAIKAEVVYSQKILLSKGASSQE